MLMLWHVHVPQSIMYEIQTMEKRKAYIEQMTAYLNDRIRELNKVKRDLAAEQKWIQVSNQRIAELAQKEKLIKLQDVMSCIKAEQDRLTGERVHRELTVLNEHAGMLNPMSCCRQPRPSLSATWLARPVSWSRTSELFAAVCPRSPLVRHVAVLVAPLVLPLLLPQLPRPRVWRCLLL